MKSMTMIILMSIGDHCEWQSVKRVTCYRAKRANVLNGLGSLQHTLISAYAIPWWAIMAVLTVNEGRREALWPRSSHPDILWL